MSTRDQARSFEILYKLERRRTLRRQAAEFVGGLLVMGLAVAGVWCVLLIGAGAVQP